jgi:hypothetical protein
MLKKKHLRVLFFQLNSLKPQLASMKSALLGK